MILGIGSPVAEKEKVTGEDWNVIRIALECLDLDRESVIPEFKREVEALYEKLQRLRLI